MNYLQMDRLR